MEKVRIGIVGMGIGRANAQGYVNHPRAEVAALCDLNAAAMEDYAGELPRRPSLFTDYKKMCASDEINAVFVGTPNQFHVPVALEAVRNGKHVIVTKPLADSLPAARSLVEAAEAAGVVNMMSLSTRFGNDVIALGNLAHSGALGDVYYGRARSVRRSGIPSWNLGFISQGGGAFRDVGVHVLDSAWWIMGMPQPVSVSGVAGARFGPHGRGYWDYKPQPELAKKFDCDDYAGGFVRFANGAGLQVESFWASHMREEFQIEILGDQAGVQSQPPTMYQVINGTPADTVIHVPKQPSSWVNIANHFISSVLDGTPCGAPLRHGLIIQQILEALLQSASSGREVAIEP